LNLNLLDALADATTIAERRLVHVAHAVHVVAREHVRWIVAERLNATVLLSSVHAVLLTAITCRQVMKMEILAEALCTKVTGAAVDAAFSKHSLTNVWTTALRSVTRTFGTMIVTRAAARHCGVRALTCRYVTARRVARRW